MTEPYYADDSVTLYAGDCFDVLRDLPDASVDAVVTDPPYGLGFMGKDWDTPGRAARATTTAIDKGANPYSGGRVEYGGASYGGAYLASLREFGAWCEQWAAECLRVLKPGGHLLAFGGTRTWHRLACAVEDAGFEVRDSIAWLTGSGFPKSLNASRALDDRRCQCQMGESDHASADSVRSMRNGRQSSAESRGSNDADVLLVQLPVEGALGDAGREPSRPDGQAGRAALRTSESRVEGRRDVQATQGKLRRPAIREVPRGSADDGPEGRVHHGTPARDGSQDRTSAAADGGRESHQPRPAGQPSGEPRAVSVERGSQAWRGWPVCGRCGKPSVPDGLGTALKPAFEPVVVARKPLGEGTVAANVLRHGTGALNIDATRIGTTDDVARSSGGWQPDGYVGGTPQRYDNAANVSPAGRWPANVVLDESQAAELDRQSGAVGAAAPASGPTYSGPSKSNSMAGAFRGNGDKAPAFHADTGGASRFFYVAKAPTAERPREDGIAHPTVKPLDLMRWLVRLVTPPGGVVLEPFAGSGTTAEACVIEGFRCIAIEREADYLPLIVQRLTKPIQPTLFGGDVA